MKYSESSSRRAKPTMPAGRDGRALATLALPAACPNPDPSRSSTSHSLCCRCRPARRNAACRLAGSASLGRVENHAAPGVGAHEIIIRGGKREARIELHRVGTRLVGGDGVEDAVERQLRFEIDVLHAGRVDIALADQLAGAVVAVEPAEDDVPLL